ncbi:hypothetical protein D3C76_1397440 [compost metagenome]
MLQADLAFILGQGGGQAQGLVKLADIARPAIGQQRLQRRLVQPGRLLCGVFGAQQVLDQFH